MITIEGTVTDILGYPTLFFSRDARSPAVSAPINAAAAGGIFARSTSSSLRVLATAPIPAAATARRTGLLAKKKFEEAGLPLLILDGDGCDRSHGGEGQTSTRLGAFLEMLGGAENE